MKVKAPFVIEKTPPQASKYFVLDLFSYRMLNCGCYVKDLRWGYFYEMLLPK